MTNLLALQSGTQLASDYTIERVLGAGGFGITYLARESKLDRLVTLKEYFPSDYAARTNGNDAAPRSQDCAGDYKWGLDRFIAEAQTLAKFNHPNIVRVYRYFEENRTAYMVLHFEEGQSLKSWLKGLGRAPRQRELDDIIGPLLDALEVIHKDDFLHRDIAPDNIIIRKNGVPVLIDFGAARGEIAAHSKTVSALVKPGYSPYEQYAETSRQQGPWSDIYALGATLYHAVTGKRPPDSPSRMVNDEMVPAAEAARAAYRRGFLNAIDRALSINVELRPQSVAAWRGALLAPDPEPRAWRPKARERQPAPAPAVTKVAGTLADSVPPPPDAPGNKGGLLDFIDGLKQKPEAAPAAAAVAPEPAVAEAKVKTAPRAPGKDAAKAAAREAPVAAEPPVADKSQPTRVWWRKSPRPKPVRSFGAPRWRPLLVKLLIGGGIAAAAVGLQEKLPQPVATSPSPPPKVALAPPQAPAKPVQQQAQAQPQTERRGINLPTSSITTDVAAARQIRGHRGPVSSVAFSADGRLLITGGQDATLRVWNAATSGLVRTVEVDNGPITALAITGRRALTGHADGTIVLWDIERGDKVGTFKRSTAGIWSLAFLGEETRFAAGTADDDVAVWDARSASEPAYLLEGHDGATQALAFSPLGTYLASASADGTVKLWNTNREDVVRTYRGHRETVSAVAFAPDGKQIATGAIDGSIRLWSATSSRLQRKLAGHKGRVAGLSYSPAGDLLASVGDDGSVRLWDPKRGRIARLMTGHTGTVRGIAYAPDGRQVASAGEDGTVRLWDAILPRAARETRE